jgi:endonuclease YncB( thermonuclease family)
VDAPETLLPNEPNEYGTITDTACLDRWGAEAAEFAMELDAQPVVLILNPVSGERDPFGRLLVYIERDGADFNAALVALGLARVQEEGISSREDGYLTLQGLAQALNLRLWKCAS